MVCDGLRWFAMVCGGLSFSHTGTICTNNCLETKENVGLTSNYSYRQLGL